MLLPAIDSSVSTDAALALGVVGRLLLTAATVDEAITQLAPLRMRTPPIHVIVRVHALAVADHAIKVLDAGAAQVVVDLDVASQDLLSTLPLDRVVVGIAAESQTVLTDKVERARKTATTVLVTATGALEEAALGAARKGFPEDAVFLFEDNKAATPESIAALDKLRIDQVAGAELRAGSLDLATAWTASLVSDRPDGLFATMVVDEQDAALGLVYSSRQSVAEAINKRRGIYQSRKHGLWYKGDSSGATQDLLQIQVDCDRDAVKFIVHQNGVGFCHLNTRSCFGPSQGLAALQATLQERKRTAVAGSYTQRLFADAALLKSKLIEEANELSDATTPEHIAAEAADVLYFAMVKCVAAGVSLADVEAVLNARSRKVTRRPGDAKPQYTQAAAAAVVAAPAAQPAAASAPTPAATAAAAAKPRIRMPSYQQAQLSADAHAKLLKRPIVESADIMSRVRPIQEAVKTRGDAALLELTEKFDRVKLTSPVIDMRAPGRKPVELNPEVKAAIDLAMGNVRRFHEAQLPKEDLRMETMPGVECSRFVRPIERVGLYVPGGSAVLPSTTYMLGVPAQVAGCQQIIVASPPGPNGSITPEVEYVAEKIGASHIVLAGGAQAVFAMAYGTESVPKVDKICGPGNQYVTAAKMLVQNDSGAMVSIDMPAGPSEVLVIADASANPAYVAADLLSQAEHGPDSQVVLVTVGLNDAQLQAIEDELEKQGEALPRAEVCRQSIPKSFTLRCDTLEQGIAFSNAYAPEHLIVNIANADAVVSKVTNAGSVFLGAYSSESCGDYASGTNHTLPTYGYARMYSGVNTSTFLKHITSQKVTREGLLNIGDAVATLAAVEGLEAHRNAVVIRLNDIRSSR